MGFVNRMMMMSSIEEEFRKNGLWMRVIAWPEDEVFALAKREKNAQKQPAPSFVTLIKEGLPVLLRGTEMGYEDCTQYSYTSNDLGDGFGLFLRTDRNRNAVDWWFTGVGKSGPDACQWEQGKRYDNGSGDFHQLWDTDVRDDSLPLFVCVVVFLKNSFSLSLSDKGDSAKDGRDSGSARRRQVFAGERGFDELSSG